MRETPLATTAARSDAPDTAVTRKAGRRPLRAYSRRHIDLQRVAGALCPA